jgi:hypothetical protein
MQITSGALRQTITGLANKDGGWPYYPGRASRLEPTCWALLALAADSGAPPTIEVLRRWPSHDGWLVDVPGAPINFAFNALAALTLVQHPDGVAAGQAIARKLIDVKGVALEQSPVLRQDNSLQAWPWVDGTFSWVEPTCWCLLLLKHPRTGVREAARDRIAVGEAMLIDRVCAGGGWNYGSAAVFGRDLWPYVPTTALGLLAMQDRRQEPAVVKSLKHLEQDVGNERSAAAVAQAVVALRVHEAAAESALTVLREALPAAETSGNAQAIAMSLYAMATSITVLDLNAVNR